MKRHSATWWLVTGAGLGSASMYFLDPSRGTRRRHGAVDRARSAVHEIGELGGKARRDLANRAHGLEARIHSVRSEHHAQRTLMSEGTPERRLLELGAGGVIALWGLARGGLAGAGAGLAGAWLLARAAFPQQRGRIRVQKTLTIDAPIGEVFRFWSRFENFPRFMDRVLEVTTEGDRSHWRVQGPAGVPVEWDAEITERIENRKLAWRSLDNSVVAHAGEVRFEAEGDNTTRINVHMTYHPPGGALGHAAAGFLLGDPKRLMDLDLLRLKSLIEQGRTRAHGHGVTRDEFPV